MKKRKKGKVVGFYPRRSTESLPIFTELHRRRGAYSASFGLSTLFDLFQCTRPDACVSVEPDEESVIIVTSMR